VVITSNGNSVATITAIADSGAADAAVAAHVAEADPHPVYLTETEADALYAAFGSGGDVASDQIWDAKGDLAVGTGANTAIRLAAGTDGFVLSANSAQASGLEWIAAPSGSGTGTSYFPSGW
jgi:hypothetical protein